MKIEFDEKRKEYVIVYDFPKIISSGKSIMEVLYDIKEAALFCIETSIERELKNISGPNLNS